MESRKMIYSKCCSNCLHFHNEDAEGNGWCYKRDTARHCSQGCLQHELKTKKDVNLQT